LPWSHAGYAVALVFPGLRPLLTDARVAGLDGGELAYRLLVRIPLGTVLWEEVAFRGCCPPQRRAHDGRIASPAHHVALGDSISIDDYSGGPGRGGSSLLFSNRDDDFPGVAWPRTS
jgi:hypothetical protein